MTGSSSTPSEPRRLPVGSRVHGRLDVPPSKSLTHRYFNLALLSGAPVIIERPLLAEDTRLFLAALERCGLRVEEGPDEVRLAPAGAAAVALSAPCEVEIFCGNAGTMLRFLVAALAALPGRWRLDGAPRLRERPVGPLVEALRRLGAGISYLEREGYAPLAVVGGSLAGGTTRLDAGESSQYLSALLMAALAAPQPVTVEVAALTSGPYVDVTLDAAARFGGRIERLDAGHAGSAAHEAHADHADHADHVSNTGRQGFHVRPWPFGTRRVPARRALRVRVEGDASAACYPAAAAALTGGTVRLRGLAADSRQGDLRFLDLLAAMGAQVRRHGGEIEVRGGELRAVAADLSAMPDQVPTLAALAPFARGTTLISNVAHLRLKESDRLAAMAGELRRLGAEVEEGPDRLAIPGIWSTAAPPRDAVTVDPHDDHRVAMSLALVGLRRPGMAIASPHVVAKSYPEFWQDMESLLAPPSNRSGRDPDRSGRSPARPER
ncbi:MAG TPA: 3-phosphoshikimate 1-carboxyvinyltransferase [Thermoanaerobaculia bacterium]|nr:3-phosphoshikimate 1-carboxyvinyltransferase [Thermoanaerobaculia bacterium]